MPINSVPVDQGAFTRLMTVAVEPKCDRDTGEQYKTKDGAARKWNVQVVASLPSKWDRGRTESEVLSVTVTSADDPRDYVNEGELVMFTDLTAGVMPPEQGESGRIRGGKLFWQASGVQSQIPAVASK